MKSEPHRESVFAQVWVAAHIFIWFAWPLLSSPAGAVYFTAFMPLAIGLCWPVAVQRRRDEVARHATTILMTLSVGGGLISYISLPAKSYYLFEIYSDLWPMVLLVPCIDAFWLVDAWVRPGYRGFLKAKRRGEGLLEVYGRAFETWGGRTLLRLLWVGAFALMLLSVFIFALGGFDGAGSNWLIRTTLLVGLWGTFLSAVVVDWFVGVKSTFAQVGLAVLALLMVAALMMAVTNRLEPVWPPERRVGIEPQLLYTLVCCGGAAVWTYVAGFLTFSSTASEWFTTPPPPPEATKPTSF